MEFYAHLSKAFFLAFILSITACGGGGGGDSSGANAQPATSIATSIVASSSMVASSAQPIASSQTTASSSSIASSSSPLSSSQSSSQPDLPPLLTGNIWHSFKDLDNPDGTFMMNPNTGVAISVQSRKWGIPWHDGSRFIDAEYNAADAPDDTTRVLVYKTSDKTLLMSQLLEGYLGHIVPSPLGNEQILAHWGETIFTPRAVIVWDMGTQKLLFSIAPSDMPDAVAWMPDGSLYRAQASGAISKITIGGGEQQIAKVSWPESRVPQAAYVSPDGTRALVQLAQLNDTGSVAWVDLWMMNIDGSEMRRYTNNGLIADAFWSPDGHYVAFVKDTGVSCTSFTCAGSCRVWYAPSTASDVIAVKESNDAFEFPLKRPNGSMTSMWCPVMAWTL